VVHLNQDLLYPFVVGVIARLPDRSGIVARGSDKNVPPGADLASVRVPELRPRVHVVIDNRDEEALSQSIPSVARTEPASSSRTIGGDETLLQ
jgi:hypothetical protein